MGSWGVTMRQSDYGLDLLGTIVDTQLKAVNFLTFKVADALEVIKADIMKEIRRANRGCYAAELVIFFSERFPYNFTQGVVIYEYVGKDCDPVEHRIREFGITEQPCNC